MTIYSVRIPESALDEAIRKAAQQYQVRPLDVLHEEYGPKRVQHARQLAMWLLRQRRRPNGATAHSYPEIGRAFGKDHTTAMYACRRVVERLAAAGVAA